MSGRMRWDRARLAERPSLDHRRENEAIERADRRLRASRRRPVVQSSPPSTVYRARHICPDGIGGTVEIIELPQAQRYRKTFAALQMKPPDHVPVLRWQQAVADGKCFLAKWGLEPNG
jgi:hypothetical protein